MGVFLSKLKIGKKEETVVEEFARAASCSVPSHTLLQVPVPSPTLLPAASPEPPKEPLFEKRAVLPDVDVETKEPISAFATKRVIVIEQKAGDEPRKRETCAGDSCPYLEPAIN